MMRWRIVGYHTVKPEEQELLARQLETFRSMGYQFCSMTQGWEMMRRGHNGKWMTVTFDDGDLSVKQYAQPVLDSLGIKAIQYITTDYLEQGSRYRDQPPTPTCSWSDLRDWIQSGHEVGSHTHTHPSMVELPTYRKEEELERSTALLQERLGEAKHHFAYPYGRYDPATRDLLNRASWVLSAVTTDRGWNYRDADSFALRRDMLETKWTAAKARVWLWRGALVGGVFEQNLPFPPASRRQDADGTLRQAESFHSRQSSLLESLAGQTRLRTLNPHLREVLRSFFYEILWWQSGRKGLVNSLPGGELVRVHPRYRYASCNLEEYYAFRRAVRPGDVALDVGANVGFYTVLLSQWVGINGRVAAFEPMPTVFHALRRHVVMNANAGPVQCFPMAVSDQCGRQSLLAAPHVGINRLAAPHEAKSAEPQCEVETISLDVFCQQHELKPNFIKIDVEGYELWVLRGARETIRQAGSQLQLFVELHPSVWPALGLSRKDIEDELAEQHLRLEPLTQQHDPWVLEGICSRLVPIGTSCGS